MCRGGRSWGTPTGEHWTGSPKKGMNQIGNKCLKNVRNCVCGPCRIFGHSFCFENYFHFSEVIFKDPPKIPFRTNIKRTSRGYFYICSKGYFLPREVISKKSPQKIVRVFRHFSTFSDILSTFLFLGCPTICPLLKLGHPKTREPGEAS